jgi:AcrR family transcriptional regulator
VARTRDQEARRKQLVAAARDVVAEKGVAAVQLRDVAKAADLTPGAVPYYYEDLHQLLQQVYEAATRRFSFDRERAIAATDAPAQRLGTALRMAVPSGPDDAELRMLFEFDAMIFGDPRYLTYAREYLDRQVRMYEQVLHSGTTAGAFTLHGSVGDIARNLLALEDSHGFSVLIGALGPDEMLRLLQNYAAAATGVTITELAGPQEH